MTSKSRLSRSAGTARPACEINRIIALWPASDENNAVNSSSVPQNILVIMPTWLGDAVMATPFLRALRNLFPAAAITCLAKDLIQPVLSGLPLIDAAKAYSTDHRGRTDFAQTARNLRKQNYDLAVILPNSFRSAFLAWRAGIPRLVGYNRDGRRLLLTDFINPVRRGEHDVRLAIQRRAARESIAAGRWPNAGAVTENLNHIPAWYVTLVGWHSFQPLPTIDYYLALAHYLGSQDTNRRMVLGITESERGEARSVMAQSAIASDVPFMLLFPGAHFGASKCWAPERFAAVAGSVADSKGSRRATVLIGGAAREKPLIEAIMAALPPTATARVIPLYKLNGGNGVSLGAMKELTRCARLVLCNDTGPRHFAAALETPLVTLFGPTDPRWAEIFCNQEKQVAVPVPCGPCQLKQCPIDHRCMTGITVEMVLQAVDQQWRKDES